jgi:hypothetical protein
MSNKELDKDSKKVAQSSRYSQFEYSKFRDVAESENRPPVKLLDSLLAIVIEARLNHKDLYRIMLEEMTSKYSNADRLEELEEEVINFTDVKK